VTNTDAEAGRQHRRHRSRSEADDLAAEYEASGLNREAFCRQKDMSLKTLARYVTRYRKQHASGSEPQRWIPVEIAGQPRHGGELSVLLPGGRRIEVTRGFDAVTLRQLVAVLEQA
jgi:hypothetical protein